MTDENLLWHCPTVLADYLDEQGSEIDASWLRGEGIYPPKVVRFSGDGDGDGSGYGDGDGDGDGSGSGSGSGSGYGYGYGSGSGSGSGYGRELLTLSNNLETGMPTIGQYVIVRSRDQGCMCGHYNGHAGREVRLLEARQIYSWSGNRLTLCDFAVVPGECNLSRIVPGESVMLEACGIIPATPEVAEYLKRR